MNSDTNLNLQVISKYLDHAIELDYTYIVVKYNVQQILGGDQV